MDDYPPLRLHVPEPSGRPGRETDFSYLQLSPAGAVRRPPVDVRPFETEDIVDLLVRVPDDEGRAVGPWDPGADPGLLRSGLRAMLLTRAVGEEVRRRGRSRVTVTYKQGEHGPEDFYRRLGFRPTGEMSEGEVVAELDLD